MWNVGHVHAAVTDTLTWRFLAATWLRLTIVNSSYLWRRVTLAVSCNNIICASIRIRIDSVEEVYRPQVKSTTCDKQTIYRYSNVQFLLTLPRSDTENTLQPFALLPILIPQKEVRKCERHADRWQAAQCHTLYLSEPYSSGRWRRAVCHPQLCSPVPPSPPLFPSLADAARGHRCHIRQATACHQTFSVRYSRNPSALLHPVRRSNTGGAT